MFLIANNLSKTGQKLRSIFTLPLKSLSALEATRQNQCFFSTHKYSIMKSPNLRLLYAFEKTQKALLAENVFDFEKEPHKKSFIAN